MTEFYVKVNPDSDNFKIEDGSIIRIYLTENAENGRANTELILKLKQILGQKPAIISGHKSRRKKLKIDMSQEKLKGKLEKLF